MAITVRLVLAAALFAPCSFASRTYISGFEMGSAGEFGQVTGTGIQSTVKRTGTYALKNGGARFDSIAAGGTGRSIFRSCRFYFRIDTALPSSDTGAFFSVGVWNLILKTTGVITLRETVTERASSSNTLSADAAWRRIEVDVGYNAGNGVQVYVDGVSWLSYGSTSGAAQVNGIVGGSGTGSSDFYFDDVIWDDDSFSNSGFPGAGQSVLLIPTAGNNVNSWTGGGGGTGGIYVGVDNIPPTGAATPADASQIKNAASGSNLDYTATMQTYTVGGISAGIVQAVMPIVNDAEEVSTATKAGGIWIASNPAQASGGNSFDFGDDVGTMGNFPSNWRTHAGPVAVGPAVIWGNAPTVVARKTGSTTRVVDVDFMGMYVDYDPAATSARLEYLQSATSATDTNVYTFSSQNLGTAASDRYIIVGVVSRDSSNGMTISGVTIGGVTATISVQVSRDDSSNSSAVGWVVANVPTGTTGDVVVTMSTTALRCGISVYRTTGIDPAAYATATDVTNGPDVSVNMLPGFVVAIGTSANAASTMTWSGVNEDNDTSIAGEASTLFAASRNSTVSWTPLTITGTVASETTFVGASASWRLAAAGGTVLQDVISRGGMIPVPR